ncbi:MAG: hypothetical protein FJZ64_04110, partial [Chlamydiae bacterium]|nr:hypothetical protein [Chlamydiota bacterium]
MKETFLGDLPIKVHQFANLDKVLKTFHDKAFLALNDRKRTEKVNWALYELIKNEEAPCFLLPAVLQFIERVEKEKILEHYTFTSFELWLNQYSSLKEEENRSIRGKITGKWIERGDYQRLFPIGMGKTYEGTHFVTAHKSPDLDTTVASFWGWMDAFSARVGDGLHIWNLPGGPPASQIEIDLVFKEIFGSSLFTHLAKTRNELNLTGNDLMSQKGLMRVTLQDSIASIDHERDHNAVIIVDHDGFYLGDWRNIDVEGIRQIIILIGSCIRWFENALHLQLISLFSKKELHFDETLPKLKMFFSQRVSESEPAVTFSSKEKKNVDEFVSKVLGLQKGMTSSFEELMEHFSKLDQVSLINHETLINKMRPLFDGKGILLENRPNLFCFLEEVIGSLHEGIVKIRERLEKLDLALKTKAEVFHLHPTFVTVRSEVEEIRSKIGSYQNLTVNYLDQGKLFPAGTIHASDLRKKTLGTVSLRDFCNRDEMTIPSYLEVISVIDHHKSELHTSAPPFAMIADVQSSNTLVATLAFEINDRYSLGGQTVKGIEEQIRSLQKQDATLLSNRILQKLLQKQRIATSSSSFFVHPLRERIEYLHFLYAI